MSPDRVKEAVAGVATTMVESLRTQPLIVGLLLVNFAFLIVMFFAVREGRAHANEQMRFLLDRCLPGRT